MIYTSVKSGLVAGRSGFCTAARHKEIKESLVSRIEDFSNQFDRGTDGTGRATSLPVVFSHRVVTIRGQTYHVLMRVADAGNDYSGRTNHIAHSIIVEPEEIDRLRVTPAEVILELSRQGIWRERYEESARLFGPAEEIDLSKFEPTSSLPATEWSTQTGNPGTAALLVEPKAASGVGVILPDSYEPDTLLKLYAESALIDSPDRTHPRKLWSHSFTTLIQSASQRTEFDWYGSVYNSRVHMALLKAKRHLVELAQGIPAPTIELSQIAEGVIQTRRAPTEESDRQVNIPSVPEGNTISQPASTPIARVALQPEATEEAEPAGIGAMATRIETGPTNAAIPSDLLGSTETGKKSSSGKWIVIAPLGVAVVAVAIGALLHFNSARVAEREIGALLEAQNWESALSKLDTFSSADREKFEAKSAGFSEYVRLLRQYESVHKDIREAAFQTESFLDRSKQLNASGSPLRLLSENREAWERNLRLHPDKLSPSPQLEKLQSQAHTAVQGYFQEEKAISETWADLMEMNSSDVDVNAMRESVFQLNTEADRLLAQIKDIENVIPFVSEYQKHRELIHENEASAKTASQELAQLSENLSTIQSKSAGREWQKYIAAIRKNIATLQPRVKVMKKTVVHSEKSTSTTPQESSSSNQGNTTDPPPIPATWFVQIPEGGEEISYAHISGMVEALPEALAIHPSPVFSNPNIERKKELAEINGETVMYYYTGQDTVKIFAIDKKKRSIQITPNFQTLFGEGFQMSWGDAGDGAPDFLVFGQPSQRSTVAFYRIGSSAGLRITNDKEAEILLSRNALRVIEQIHLPPGEVTHELYLSEGSVPAAVSSEGAEALRMSPSRRIDLQIAELEAQVKNYASIREVSAQFDAAFANLGEKLFELKDGKIKTDGLKVKSFPQKAKPPNFGLVADSERTETVTADVRKSLKEYIARSGDFIEGPPFFHYLSAHLGEHLWDHGISNSKSISPEGKEAIRKAFAKIRATENWGPEEVAEAVRLLSEITETGKTFRLQSTVELKDRFGNQEEAERSRKRQENNFRHNQIVSRFFQTWEKVFTPENLQIVEKVTLAGGSGGFDEARFQKMKSELDTVKAERSSLTKAPLSELGTFRVTARIKNENGKETIFHLLEISGN